jgi:hypothetical protein
MKRWLFLAALIIAMAVLLLLMSFLRKPHFTRIEAQGHDIVIEAQARNWKGRVGESVISYVVLCGSDSELKGPLRANHHSLQTLLAVHDLSDLSRSWSRYEFGRKYAIHLYEFKPYDRYYLIGYADSLDATPWIHDVEDVTEVYRQAAKGLPPFGPPWPPSPDSEVPNTISRDSVAP